MKGITLARAIKAFASEVGCSDENDREKFLDAIQEGIEWTLLNGGGNLLREWTVTARNGLFVLPRDLETPIHFKFGKTAKSGFGTFRDGYFSYGSQSVSDCCGYFNWKTDMESRINPVVSQYRPPMCGVRLVLTTKNPLDVGKKVMVGGKQRGFDIVGLHNGFKTSGELLTVYAENSKKKKYSSFTFDELTHIVKDDMCDYIMLSGVDEDENIYHLGHYHPDDNVPSFNEVQVFNCERFGCQTGCDYDLQILGRVNPSLRYIRDEDVLPITSFEMLKLLAKRARYDDGGDFNEVGATEQRLRILIKKQVAYQQKANRQLSVDLRASGYTLSNL